MTLLNTVPSHRFITHRVQRLRIHWNLIYTVLAFEPDTNVSIVGALSGTHRNESRIWPNPNVLKDYHVNRKLSDIS